MQLKFCSRDVVKTLVNDNLGLTFWVIAYGKFSCIIALKNPELKKKQKEMFGNQKKQE